MKLFSKIADPGQISAFMRHVANSTGVIVAVLGFVGLSQGDATAIGHAVQQIGDGVVSIISGLSVLVTFMCGLYASYTASRESKMKALNADPQIEQVIAKPGTAAAAVADSIPGNKVTVA